MTLLRKATPQIANLEFVLIFDWEKGLLPVVHCVLPTIVHDHYTWHMGHDIRVSFGKKWVKVFDKVVYATTPNQLK